VQGLKDIEPFRWHPDFTEIDSVFDSIDESLKP
jgi:hypothetical protein